MSARIRLAILFACALAGLASGAALAAPAPVPPARSAAASSEDIRDIHGPVAIPSPWRLLAIAGGALVLAGMGATTALVLRRRRARPPTADERALARLEEARVLARAGRPREYAAAASDAVRGYIEERFGLGATHATTEEFLHQLVDDERSPLGPHREPLMQFLSACDLAKFARLQLPAEGMTSLTDLARQFVITTATPPADQLSPSRTS